MQRLILILTTLLAWWPRMGLTKPHSDRTVILVSIDGMRWDYIDLHGSRHLKKLRQRSLRAEQFRPIFPSKTFPNHYTIVTGLYAENHGLIGNSFYATDLDLEYSLSDREAVADGRFYGGEPIWVTARKQGLRTACYFWPGSEAAIKDTRPEVYQPYKHSTYGRARVAKVLDWLRARQRPHFISLYFSDVDSAGHKYGPMASQTKRAVQRVDAWIEMLNRGIQNLRLADKVDVIIVSDHGMKDTSHFQTINATKALAPLQAKRLVVSSTMVFIWPEAGQDPTKHPSLTGLPFTVLAKEDLPARYHFQNHERIPPYMALPHQGFVFRKSDQPASPGTHGFDNLDQDMAGIFIAYGPSFPAKALPVVENIEIYGLISHILGLQPAKNDGKGVLLEASRGARPTPSRLEL